MRVAVTGATGYVGRFVVADLLAAGHAVRAWARPASDRGGFPAAIAWCDGGLDVADSEVDLVGGVDALVHAAFMHVPGRYRGGEGDDAAAFLATNLEGSLRLVRAARRAGVARVVFLSSRAVYGERLWDRPLDERHPLRPTTHYGAYKAAVEAVLRGYGKAEGWAAASLRSTGVYGIAGEPGRAKWAEVVAASLAGEAPPPRAATEVHGADLAAAVRLMLEFPAAAVAGEAFNVADVVVSHRAVTRLAGGALAPAAPPPAGVMATAKLQALGWRPRGWGGVVETVASLAATLGRERGGRRMRDASRRRGIR
jgi:nucleoside-diphosphate-sugar epimerase